MMHLSAKIRIVYKVLLLLGLLLFVRCQDLHTNLAVTEVLNGNVCVWNEYSQKCHPYQCSLYHEDIHCTRREECPCSSWCRDISCYTSLCSAIVNRNSSFCINKHEVKVAVTVIRVGESVSVQNKYPYDVYHSKERMLSSDYIPILGTAQANLTHTGTYIVFLGEDALHSCRVILFFLFVLGEPQITEKQTKNETTMTLMCVPQFVHNPSLFTKHSTTWKRNGRVIVGSENVAVSNNNLIVGPIACGYRYSTFQCITEILLDGSRFPESNSVQPGQIRYSVDDGPELIVHDVIEVVESSQLYIKLSFRTNCSNISLFHCQEQKSVGILISQDNHVTYRIPAIKCTHTGSYCMADLEQLSSYANDTSTFEIFRVNVACSPRVILEDRHDLVKAGSIGQTVSLHVNIIANPSPEITWISNVHGKVTQQMNEFTYSVQGFLNIYNDTYFGDYEVFISNNISNSLTVTFHVIPAAGLGIEQIHYCADGGTCIIMRNTITEEENTRFDIEMTFNRNVSGTKVIISRYLNPDSVVEEMAQSNTVRVQMPVLQCSDTGIYHVTALNTSLRDMRSTSPLELFKINVLCSPRRIENEEHFVEMFGSLESSLMLITTVIANPKPSSIWFPKVSKESVIKLNEYTYRIKGVLDTLKTANFRNYKVTITNGLAESLNITFQVNENGRTSSISPILLSVIIGSVVIGLILVFCVCFLYSKRNSVRKSTNQRMTNITDSNIAKPDAEQINRNLDDDIYDDITLKSSSEQSSQIRVNNGSEEVFGYEDLVQHNIEKPLQHYEQLDLNTYDDVASSLRGNEQHTTGYLQMSSPHCVQIHVQRRIDDVDIFPNKAKLQGPGHLQNNLQEYEKMQLHVNRAVTTLAHKNEHIQVSTDLTFPPLDQSMVLANTGAVEQSSETNETPYSDTVRHVERTELSLRSSVGVSSLENEQNQAKIDRTPPSDQDQCQTNVSVAGLSPAQKEIQGGDSIIRNVKDYDLKQLYLPEAAAVSCVQTEKNQDYVDMTYLPPTPFQVQTNADVAEHSPEIPYQEYPIRNNIQKYEEMQLYSPESASIPQSLQNEQIQNYIDMTPSISNQIQFHTSVNETEQSPAQKEIAYENTIRNNVQEYEEMHPHLTEADIPIQDCIDMTHSPSYQIQFPTNVRPIEQNPTQKDLQDRDPIGKSGQEYEQMQLNSLEAASASCLQIEKKSELH